MPEKPIEIKLNKENYSFKRLVKQIIPINKNESEKKIDFQLLEVSRTTWRVIEEIQKSIIEQKILPNYNDNVFRINLINEDIQEIKSSYKSWKEQGEDKHKNSPHIIQNKKSKKHIINLPVIYGAIFSPALEGIENVNIKNIGSMFHNANIKN